MNNREHQTVRPSWVCGLGGGAAGEGSRDACDEFAEDLKAKVDRKKQEDELDDKFQKVFGHKPGEGPDEGHETDDQEVDLDRENGHRVVRSLLDPKLPREEEVHRHNLTHMPYRSWCPHCVRGRGKEMSHRRRKDLEEASIPEYHLDYCFPGDEDGNKLTVLVVVERHRQVRGEDGHGTH